MSNETRINTQEACELVYRHAQLTERLIVNQMNQKLNNPGLEKQLHNVTVKLLTGLLQRPPADSEIDQAYGG